MKTKGLVWLFSFLALMVVFSCSDEPVSPEKNGHIRGKVTDAETGQGVPVCVINTSPPTVSITTDSAGNYQILNIPEGNYTVTASKKDYLKTSVSVAVKGGDTTIANIILSPSENKNTQPSIPDNPTPANGATDQPTELTLSWSASDPDPDDSLSFDILFYQANEAPRYIVVDWRDSSYTVSQLNYNTTYYWQVKVRDSQGATSLGEVWSFTTLPLPHNPIVFASNRNGNFEIYSTGPDSSETRLVQLTRTESREWWPRLSPTGEKIAFVSDRTIEYQIFTMNRDGSEVFQVTSLPVAGYHNYGMGFCWSPTGTQFLYSHYDKLYRINIDRSNLTEIATAPAGRNFREVDWSPLGDKIVVLTIGSWFYDSEIYLMNADGSNMTLLVDNWPGAIESPSFSPDGSKILFTHDISGFEAGNGRQMDTHIFLLDLASGDTTDLSSGKPAGTNDLYPRFSPDGSRIIFCNAPNDGSNPGDLWLMETNGQNRKKLLANGMMPDWQ